MGYVANYGHDELPSDDETFCRWFLTRVERRSRSAVQGDRTGSRTLAPELRREDVEDLMQELRVALWQARKSWDPARNVPLAAYATQRLGWARQEWYRAWLGRHGQRPLPFAESLDVRFDGPDEEFDADRVGRLEPDERSSPGGLAGGGATTAEREIHRRRGGVARALAEIRARPASRSTQGDQDAVGEAA